MKITVHTLAKLQGTTIKIDGKFAGRIYASDEIADRGERSDGFRYIEAPLWKNLDLAPKFTGATIESIVEQIKAAA